MPSSPAIVLHHLEDSRSLRIIWLLEELGLEYEIKSYARDPDTARAPPELREVHPLGRAPVITVDGEAFAETGAIIEYCTVTLCGGMLVPSRESPEFKDYTYFLHYAEGSLSPPLLVKLIFSKLKAAKVPFFIKPIISRIVQGVDGSYSDPEIRNHMDFVEGILSKRTWICGDAFSAADVIMIYPLENALEKGLAPGAYPGIHSWLARCQERDGWKRAVERGGK
jgi:glutathione S-transferase